MFAKIVFVKSACSRVRTTCFPGLLFIVRKFSPYERTISGTVRAHDLAISECAVVAGTYAVCTYIIEYSEHSVYNDIQYEISHISMLIRDTKQVCLGPLPTS